MKLLICLNCWDIFNLTLDEKKCSCGKCGGQYINYENAVYWGNCVPLGLLNKSLLSAIRRQPENGLGEVFTAFVIPKNCESFKKIDNDAIK